MNVREFQYQFGSQINQFDEALQLSSDDIQYWLNKAQIELVKEKYNGFNRKRKGFEQSQQRIDDLRILIKRNVAIETFYSDEISGTQGFYSDYIHLPRDYMFLISNKSKVIYNYPEINWNIVSHKRVPIGSTNEKISFNRFSQSDHIYNLLSDPFNKPKPGSPIIVVNNNHITVFTDNTFIVSEIIIDYLRLPRAMNIREDITSELPEHMHEEIIQRAVDLFLNNTRQLKQRLQRETPTADQQNIENNE